jgi:hypothetical protein
MVTMRPRYRRAEIAPPMRFQERDGELLSAIYRYDGVLAKRQVKELFWPNASWRAMEMRLSLLYHQGYLDWPGLDAWRTNDIPEPICWLGWKGALWIAGRLGVDVAISGVPSEAHLHRLENTLHTQGVRWVREPRWSQLAHDVTIVDIRRAVEEAVRTVSTLTLETWVAEGIFRTRTDVVEYVARGGKKRKGVRPDGYFVLLDERRRKQGLPARARFLLEVDMATHDIGSFADEKVLAGRAYVRSQAYGVRFGDNSGRWLVVTTTDIRRDNLMHQTHQVVGTDTQMFLFTTLGQVMQANILTAPIWWQAGSETPMPLFAEKNGQM